MSGMLAALKNKRKGMALEGDHQDMGHDSAHADDKQKDLHGLVASLSDSEKTNLKALLHSDGAGAEKIAKGSPSSEEQGHIQDAMTKENGMNQLESDDESHEDFSDNIAKSMLDSRHLGGNPPTGKPRNLGERMKMNLASNLKAKGKI